MQPESVSFADLLDSSFTWLILEPSLSGTSDGFFSFDQIESLRTTGPCGRRIVLAYLSIGEAEDYRDYWNPAWVDDDGWPVPGLAPSWLGPPNPDFGGNYKVRYWEPAWQDLILGTAGGEQAAPLDRIVNAGFDGVYLDIVDAYEFWSSPDGANELARSQARRRMIEWVERISAYAKTTRGKTDFLVFGQNASDIIRDDAGDLDELSDAYFAAVDGIGIEDLFYDETTPQPDEGVQYRLEQLAEFRARGKTVLVTDYILAESYTPDNSDDRAAEFYGLTLAEDFIPYAAVEDRNLDEIIVLAPPAWSVTQPPTECIGE